MNINSDIIIIAIAVLVVLAVGLMAGNAMMMMRVMTVKTGKRSDISTQLAELKILFEEYSMRAELIERHAVDYLTAMSSDANRCFSLAKQMLFAIGELITNVERLEEINSASSLHEADELLKQKLNFSRSAVTSLQYTHEPPDLYFNQWAPALEQLFSMVGSEVSAASKNSIKTLGTGRERRNTLMDLRSAGVYISTGDTFDQEAEEEENDPLRNEQLPH